MTHAHYGLGMRRLCEIDNTDVEGYARGQPRARKGGGSFSVSDGIARVATQALHVRDEFLHGDATSFMRIFHVRQLMRNGNTDAVTNLTCEVIACMLALQRKSDNDSAGQLGSGETLSRFICLPIVSLGVNIASSIFGGT